MLRKTIETSILALAAAVLLTDASPAQPLESSCPMTSNPVDYGTGTLNTGIDEFDGVEYVEDMSGGRLVLRRSAGDFRVATLMTPVIGLTHVSAGDFDGDGWEDLISGDVSGLTRVVHNESYWSFLPGPDSWLDPVFVLDADFFPWFDDLGIDAFGNTAMTLAAGDFNGDGWADVFRANSSIGSYTQSAELWLNSQVPSWPTFDPSYDALSGGTFAWDLGLTMETGGNNIQVLDYNGDRKLDLLVAAADGGGTINIFLNDCTLQSPLPPSPPAPPAPLPCSDAPTFSYYGPLIWGLGLGGEVVGQLPVFAYEDFDGDGYRDLIAGSPLCCTDPTQRLRMWRGTSGGALEATPSQYLDFVGAAVVVLAADFSLDGHTDLVVGTDGGYYGAASNIGGQLFYYENDGTATPFSAGPNLPQMTTYGAPSTDFDMGTVVNYDNDPDSTPDIVIADDNDIPLFQANRLMSEYVECGNVISGVLDLGPLAGSEMVVTSARMTPTVTLNGGTVRFWMTNEDPPNWVDATQANCGDASGDVCALFPNAAGSDVRWKAELCSSPDHLNSPDISGISVRFDYTEALQHLRAGVVISDGVAYLGTFSQPGNRGRLYAMNTGLGTIYWEFGAKLDAMLDSEREIFTATASGQDPLELRWTGDGVHDSALLTTLAASGQTQAQEIIDWVRSARFGVAGSSTPMTRLGGIETSTPAVINKPGLPLWYTLAGTDDRSAVDAFVAQYSNRRPYVLFGAKDGMVHAVRNDATDITNTDNGKEAWAFVPNEMASRLVADHTQTQVSGTLAISAYPDGAPTVADIKLGGQMATVALVGGGNGGKSVTALNITETIHPSTGTGLGPDPLWNATPGDPDAGQGLAKPVLARVDIGGQERFIAIAGTGVDADPSKGRTVVAYDVETGAPLWKFLARCALTSHIAVFETDDGGEPGSPEIDGFMDRAVFADECGYVYKVDPAKDLAGGWNGNSGLGSIATEMPGGVQLYALFSTATSANGICDIAGVSCDLGNPDPAVDNGERPIAGTMGVRADSTTDVVIYFGTGGLRDYDPTRINAFFAIYAQDGTVRSRYVPSNPCGVKCEKFYGGVVVTTEQVIFSRAVDPEIGTGTCNAGSSFVDIMQLEAGAGLDFDAAYDSIALSGAAVGSMYGDAGAVYLATVSGDIVRIGTPRVTDAGGDTTGGNTGGLGGGQAGTTGTNEPLVLMGWRQVF